MDKITWQPSFSVGVAELDAQHKQLVHLINMLISAHDIDVKSEAVSQALTTMTKYAHEHFEAEELLMKEHGYPELTAHEEEHRQFRLKTVAFCMGTMNKQPEIPPALIDYLKNWLLNHILNTDMAYRDFFNQRGVR